MGNSLRVSIVGAGPAGIAAALELARGGADVTLYEQHRTPGGHKSGDFQAFENWTSEEDALDGLQRLGIVADFACRATRRITMADAALRRYAVAGGRPLFYLVKRGPDQDSLDTRLAAQAAACGVAFEFGRRVHAEELRGPVIVATGARETQGIVAGIVAKTSHPDQVVVIVSDALAPKGYAYCVIWSGRATLATVAMRDFPRAWACFNDARRALAAMGLSEFRDERRFGGRAQVSRTPRLTEGGRLYVGEAAGLQDHLFGFGLRYAIRSGHLAARALLTGESYETLVARELRGPLRAGFVNRLVFDRLGDRGYRWFLRWLAGSDGGRRAGRLYSFSLWHRALWPLVALSRHA